MGDLLISPSVPFLAATTAADITPGITPGTATDSADHALHLTAAFAGFAAYGLMVATVVWGVLTATNLVRSSIRRETLYGGHMTMAIAAICFAIVHAAGNVFRPAADLSIWSATVPYLGTTTAIATGVISLELAVVTGISIWFQRRLGYRRWQIVHWLGYPTYVFAIIHTMVAGSDVRVPLIAILLVVSVLLVGLAVVLRVLPSNSPVRDRIAVREYR